MRLNQYRDGIEDKSYSRERIRTIKRPRSFIFREPRIARLRRMKP